MTDTWTDSGGRVWRVNVLPGCGDLEMFSDNHAGSSGTMRVVLVMDGAVSVSGVAPIDAVEHAIKLWRDRGSR